MKNNGFLFTLAFFLLTACTPAPTLASTSVPTNTLIPSPTSTPTATPIPFAGLTGSLFFDYNGSGLWDEGEPPIVGFGVCAKIWGEEEKVCEETNKQGEFSFEALAPEETDIFLTFDDHNADDPALAFRYINLWHGPVTIPAYEVNGVQVPEQHLNDTEVKEIGESVSYKVGDAIELGLMQGFLTLPFLVEQVPEPFIWNYFDILGYRIFNSEISYWDTQDGNIMDYSGVYLSEGNPFRRTPGVGDSHNGLDFVVEVNTFILNTGPNSRVYDEILESDGQLILHIEVNNHGLSNYVTEYAHLNKWLVNEGQEIYRGQIVALSGNTGSRNTFNDYGVIKLTPQLHYSLFVRCCGGWKSLDPYRFIVFLDVPTENFWGSPVSYWTKDNDPQFSK